MFYVCSDAKVRNYFTRTYICNALPSTSLSLDVLVYSIWWFNCTFIHEMMVSPLALILKVFKTPSMFLYPITSTGLCVFFSENSSLTSSVCLKCGVPEFLSCRVPYRVNLIRWSSLSLRTSCSFAYGIFESQPWPRIDETQEKNLLPWVST